MFCPARSLRTQGPRVIACSLGILFGLLTTEARGQSQVLWGMNDVDQLGGPDEIVRIDIATGVATRIHVFHTGFNLLESLCFDARENVLWTTNDGTLYRVDPRTFNTLLVGETGVEDVDGLTVQPSTGNLYGITYGGNDLIRIDKSDAGTTILNGHLEEGTRLEDLAFDSTGRLYVLTSRALVEVNPATGERISKVLWKGAVSLEGLVWDSERGTFLSAADRGTSKDLVAINRTTGVVTFLNNTQHSGFRDIEALAFLPGGSIVPVAMLALDAERTATGARLAWEGARDDVSYSVERGFDAAGPWTGVAHVDVPVSGRAPAWRFEFSDLEAGPFADRTLHYRVGAVDESGVWAYLTFEIAAAPASPIMLRPNAPNPFNPTTAFEVRTSGAANVELTLFDIQGRVVRSIRAAVGAGTHQLVWDGRDSDGRGVAAGVYPYLLRGGSQVLRGRAVLVK